MPLALTISMLHTVLHIIGYFFMETRKEEVKKPTLPTVVQLVFITGALSHICVMYIKSLNSAYLMHHLFFDSGIKT